MFLSHKVGQIGEKAAGKFLKSKGFSILEVNYSRPWGELDLVVQKGESLRFIEVKTVTVEKNVSHENLDDFYEPEANIHQAKLKRLSRIIETYLLDKNIDEDIDYQLDSVAVFLDRQQKVITIRWLENIF